MSYMVYIVPMFIGFYIYLWGDNGDD